MSDRILRHGLFQLGNKERPRCPECDSTAAEIEPFNINDYINVINYIDSITLSCPTCGCVWQIFSGDAPEFKAERPIKKDETKRH